MSSDAECFALSAGRPPRGLDVLELQHATLPPAIDVTRVGGALRVIRRPVEARPLAEVSGNREHGPALFLQAATAAAFFSAHGFPIAPDDLERAGVSLDDGGPCLWLAGAPRSAAADDPHPHPSANAAASAAEALAAFLERLFARGSRITHRGAAALLERLRAPEARWKRPEFWIASALRAFPELAGPGAAAARSRGLGLCGDTLRSAAARAVVAKARALAAGCEPRLLGSSVSPLSPGSALGLPDVRDAAEASRRLRAEAEESRGRAVWIAVAPEDWDPLSNRALESAALSLPDRVELVRVPRVLPAPASPADWRRALWVPCGTLAASVRFYERFAELAGGDAEEAVELARGILGHDEWARFAADPTGDAPWPEASAPQRTVCMPREPGAATPEDPGSRIERLLCAGETGGAIEEARSWIQAFPGRAPETWFPLAARLVAGCGGVTAPWLEALEAEREAAGGRPAEARARLERLLRTARPAPEERRRFELRLAELSACLDSASEAARRAAAWRRAHRDAPASESVRALRLGAAGAAREGRFEDAVALLEEADAGRELAPPERVETALVRAQVFALAGRVGEEEAAYEAVRSLALGCGDDGLAARFLAQEARRLLDRREHARAILRFREALAAVRDDPGERAGLLLDLAAALYHSGDEAGSEASLTECLAVAAAAGREDLVRLARGNRIELWINRCAWDEAAAEIAALEALARSDRDDVRLLVVLHHRGRLALRRGFLAAAAADNARARELSARLADRLEIGELWLEDGDRRLYANDLDGAREAYAQAAEAPPDRSARDGLARARLDELSWRRDGAPPEEAIAALETRFRDDPYGAAEAFVRWRFVLGETALPEALRTRAERVLRAMGGEALAEHAFPTGSPPVPREALRGLREAVTAAVHGEEPDGHRALGMLGLSGLALRDADGREFVRLGSGGSPAETSCVKRLEAGRARFELVLWPAASAEAVDSVALLLETLLFRAEPAPPPNDFADGWRRLGLVTADPSMEEPYRRLTRFAAQSVTVLVLGASGCGKEAVARAVHRLSPRASGPFVAVNVPAMPAALLESELFGHARGAFTGAERDRRGLLEEAAGGSIFFDEIGDLAPALQAKLLRALQEREIRRVGENRARPIDVRVISATSRDLAERVESGQFREDLFYRLHVAVLRLPPLRDRGRDALLLARHFLEEFGREYGRGRLHLTPEASAAILTYPWPGNVRELQNAVSQAAALCDPDGAVGSALLPEGVRRATRIAESAGDYHARLDSHRRDLIAGALGRSGGNRTRAARELGLSRQALHYLIRELKVEVRSSKQ